MKKNWFRKGLMFFTLFIAAVLLFGAIVMGLWNALLPAILGVKTITFIQALGILLLSKILFGGFGHGRGWHGARGRWRNKMQEKWGNMTQEEKENFRAEWKNRCGGRGWRMEKENSPQPTEE